MNQPIVKRLPWWLKLVFGGNRCVTLYPHIYTPGNQEVYHFDSITWNHELFHWWHQNAMGLWTYLWHYGLDKAWRLQEEAEATAASCVYVGEDRRTSEYKMMALALNSSDYNFAAASYPEAMAAIFAAERSWDVKAFLVWTAGRYGKVNQ